MGVPKIFQWLIVLSISLSIWMAYAVGYFKTDLSKEYHDIIIVLPIYALITFACWVLAVIGFRVATFNDCVDASEQLKEQILEARRDLEKKGYKYASDWK
ncbi:dolichol-phosphate mannosyltransferase subunit 3-like [Physella acuta]|uniref:dolichol-phosphate mannosyltransferase subunit 3-like n=1 Tax=Physella acuta TaxID=109671 RepID=UPI0027DD7568|nr:dolichol-phosphate mannosyltransferase subunit 3-like [Physella acuta]